MGFSEGPLFSLTRQQGRAAGRQCDRPFPLSADPEGRQGLGSSQQAAEGDPDAMLDNNLGAHFAQPLIYIEVLKRYNLFSDPAGQEYQAEKIITQHSFRRRKPCRHFMRSAPEVYYIITPVKNKRPTQDPEQLHHFAFSGSDPAAGKEREAGQATAAGSRPRFASARIWRLAGLLFIGL